jgi:lycopene cyclase domain-containing protein
MTYFSFLLYFLLSPILIFLGITYRANNNNKQISRLQNGHAVWMGIGIHVLLAVIYTTPWDNYLVATGVWYYNPKLVTDLLIGYVPLEEYTFFVLETVLSGLWWWFLARRMTMIPRSGFPDGHETGAMDKEEFKPNKLPAYVSTCIVAPLWLAFTYLFFFGTAKWTYLSITLFWALPPIIVQLLFGADILWHYRKFVLRAIIVPTIYLSLMDIVALRETTWSISPGQTTGILFFGILPLEEVVFFFITNMLIIFGMTLLLANVSRERFAGIRKQVRGWKERRSLDLQSR